MRPSRKETASGSRARRFDLCLPVSFRIGNEQQWRTGTTESISSTGALIRARQSVGVAVARACPEGKSVAPSDPIVVAISLPVVPGCLIGRGRIVRMLESGAHTDGTSFAVMVDRFRVGRMKSQRGTRPSDELIGNSSDRPASSEPRISTGINSQLPIPNSQS
jgi:hypothetical protein